MFLIQLSNQKYFIKYKNNKSYTQTTTGSTNKKIADIRLKYFEYGGIELLKVSIKNDVTLFNQKELERLQSILSNPISINKKKEYESPINPLTITLKELMYKMDSITKDNFVLNTFKSLIRYFNNNGNKLVSSITTEDIDNEDEDVTDWKKFRLNEFKRYSKTQRLSPNTVNSEIRYCKIYFKRALKKKWITFNPFEDVKYISVPKNLFTVYDMNQRQILINNCTNELLKNIIKFDFGTACRVSEICNVMFDDIDFERKTLRITNKEDFLTKNRCVRVVPASDELINLLLSIDRIEGCPYVFNLNGKKLYPDYITKNFKKELRKNGFNEKYHFHNIRHSVCTDFFLNNKNFNPLKIKTWMGHKNLESTLKYGSVNVEDVRELSDSMRLLAS